MNKRLVLSAAAAVIATAGAGAQGPADGLQKRGVALIEIPGKVWFEPECDEVAVEDYPFLRVLVAFGANSDGTRATAEFLGEQSMPNPVVPGGPQQPTGWKIYRPASPWLSAGPRDFVKEMIHLTNRVLANSNAPFRLDENDVLYDRIDDDKMNRATDNVMLREEFQKRIDTDPRYNKRVIFHIPWGKGPVPRSNGLSDVDSNFVGLPARMDGDTKWRGRPVWGWYMMAHEFGHFMGLQHTAYSPIRRPYEALAAGARGALIATDEKGVRNVRFSQPASRPQSFHPQQLDPQLAKDRAVMAAWIKERMAGNIDQDVNSYMRPEGRVQPKWTVAGVADTPVDFGLGMAPTEAGQDPCQPYSMVIGETTFTNQVNRSNVMSYTICQPESLRYSPGQVKVMTDMLRRAGKARFVHRRKGKILKCGMAPSKVAGGM
jgi:hypothetical protein